MIEIDVVVRRVERRSFAVMATFACELALSLGPLRVLDVGRMRGLVDRFGVLCAGVDLVLVSGSVEGVGLCGDMKALLDGLDEEPEDLSAYALDAVVGAYYALRVRSSDDGYWLKQCVVRSWNAVNSLEQVGFSRSVVGRFEAAVGAVCRRTRVVGVGRLGELFDPVRDAVDGAAKVALGAAG